MLHVLADTRTDQPLFITRNFIKMKRRQHFLLLTNAKQIKKQFTWYLASNKIGLLKLTTGTKKWIHKPCYSIILPKWELNDCVKQMINSQCNKVMDSHSLMQLHSWQSLYKCIGCLQANFRRINHIFHIYSDRRNFRNCQCDQQPYNL